MRIYQRARRRAIAQSDILEIDVDQQKIALLKKALRNLSSAINVLSEREREQLKDLILKGQVGNEDELRGYLSRLISARARQREKEKQKQQERQQTARAQQKREEEGEEPAQMHATLEADSDDPSNPTVSLDDEADAASDNEPAKITGKVIDAKSRKAVPYVRVRVIGTSFNEETETTGVFIWEELPRGRQITFEFSRKDYKNATLQYRSTQDNEQHVVVKLVPQDSKGDKKSGGKSGGH